MGGEMGRAGAARATHPSDRRMWPRGPRGTRLMAASCGWECKRDVCVCERVWEGSAGQARSVFGKGNVFAFVSMGIDTKTNTRAAAHFSSVICVSLRMAASAEAPLAPMLLYRRLQRDRWGR
jgi:hypothetical protein